MPLSRLITDAGARAPRAKSYCDQRAGRVVAQLFSVCTKDARLDHENTVSPEVKAVDPTRLDPS